MAAFVPPIISGLTLLKNQQAQKAEETRQAQAQSFTDLITRLYLESQNQENR